MTGFHAIKTNLFAYSSVLASLDDELMNEKLLHTAIQQLTQFQDSLSSLDRPPLKLEIITKEDRTVIMDLVDQIAERFYKRLGLSDDIITLFNIHEHYGDIISVLIEENEIGLLTCLAPLADKLETCAAQTSCNISQQVTIYLDGELKAEDAQVTLEIVVQQLNLLKKQLLSAKQELQNLVQITTLWINQRKSVPEDFLLKVKSHIGKLYEVFGKISSSLVHEAENMHPAIHLLQYKVDPHHQARIDPSFCPHGYNVLNYFQQLDALTTTVKKHFNEEHPSWAILLYNAYRLKTMVDKADAMLIELPKKVEDLLQILFTSTSCLRSLIEISSEEDQLRYQKQFDEHKPRIQELEYTKAHLDLLFKHPAYLEAKALVMQMGKHQVSSPLTFNSNFWLLQSLQLTSFEDAGILFRALEKYTQTFFSLLYIFQNRSEERKRRPSQSIWIPLIQLDELTSKLET
jgi:hypothetical protein